MGSLVRTAAAAAASSRPRLLICDWQAALLSYPARLRGARSTQPLGRLTKGFNVQRSIPVPRQSNSEFSDQALSDTDTDSLHFRRGYRAEIAIVAV